MKQQSKTESKAPVQFAAVPAKGLLPSYTVFLMHTHESLCNREHRMQWMQELRSASGHAFSGRHVYFFCNSVLDMECTNSKCIISVTRIVISSSAGKEIGLVLFISTGTNEMTCELYLILASHVIFNNATMVLYQLQLFYKQPVKI